VLRSGSYEDILSVLSKWINIITQYSLSLGTKIDVNTKIFATIKIGFWLRL